MKLRNKKTGEIGTLYQNGEGVFYEIWVSASGHKYLVDSLAELNEEWEDYEEPKDSIDYIGLLLEDYNKQTVEIHFETKEEAEKAVEKLKAWKRLKDKGIKTVKWTAGLGDDNYKIGEVMVGFDINGVYDGDVPNDIEKDLDLLFGGEE